MAQHGPAHSFRDAVDRRLLRSTGRLAQFGGLVLIAVGAAGWATVSSQLDREHIEVHKNAPFLQGKAVRGPFTAFAQAEAIQRNSLKASGGKTYAELPMDDPARANVMNGSFLRGTLFTSVLAFGVSAFAVGAGALVWLLGGAARRAGRIGR